ncbi:hypothetical protein B0H13DRAFT_1857488 [Mycena leptocephala]|nr:hypothetical protein B0H13DRAFT_1857488 [Mycena leptocephala]
MVCVALEARREGVECDKDDNAHKTGLRFAPGNELQKTQCSNYKQFVDTDSECVLRDGKLTRSNLELLSIYGDILPKRRPSDNLATAESRPRQTGPVAVSDGDGSEPYTSDSDYDAEDEPSESVQDDESDDEYLAIPEPSTWLATHSLDSELQVQPSGTIQVHSMRDAELHFAGPIDKKGGAKDKTGKLRGTYLVGEISQREAERRRAAARKQQEESMADSGQNGWSLNTLLFGNCRVLLRGRINTKLPAKVFWKNFGNKLVSGERRNGVG